MFYAIRHFTRYRYSRPVWQTVMEARMHPRTENNQRCFTFQLAVKPRARIFSYTDHLGNLVHHFDIPSDHTQLTILADALVDVTSPPEVPQSLGSGAWRELERMLEADDYWDMLMPSRFGRSSSDLEALARELGVDERAGRDPLELALSINGAIARTFAYLKKSTKVDSPIEVALAARSGVCQDFAHIMISLLRNLRIPSRYVSGYLFYAQESEMEHGATHAWVEALMPGLGWVGFDPTHDQLVRDQHIRTAVGRDYADVPPTWGTMKGSAMTELQVRVRVTPSDAVLPPDQEFAADEEWSRVLEKDQQAEEMLAQAQQQQQQQ